MQRRQWFGRDERPLWIMAAAWGAGGTVHLVVDGTSWWAGLSLVLAAAAAGSAVLQVLRPRPPRKITDDQVRTLVRRSGGHLPPSRHQPGGGAPRR